MWGGVGRLAPTLAPSQAMSGHLGPAVHARPACRRRHSHRPPDRHRASHASEVLLAHAAALERRAEQARRRRRAGKQQHARHLRHGSRVEDGARARSRTGRKGGGRASRWALHLPVETVQHVQPAPSPSPSSSSSPSASSSSASSPSPSTEVEVGSLMRQDLDQRVAAVPPRVVHRHACRQTRPSLLRPGCRCPCCSPRPPLSLSLARSPSRWHACGLVQDKEVVSLEQQPDRRSGHRRLRPHHLMHQPVSVPEDGLRSTRTAIEGEPARRYRLLRRAACAIGERGAGVQELGSSLQVLGGAEHLVAHDVEHLPADPPPLCVGDKLMRVRHDVPAAIAYLVPGGAQRHGWTG